MHKTTDCVLQGLDLDAMGKAGRFVFVDGLTGLFTTDDDRIAAASKDRTLRKPGDLKKEIEAALDDLKPSRRVLIVDQPDALLAASGDEVTSLSLQNTLLSLREVNTSHTLIPHKSMY